MRFFPSPIRDTTNRDTRRLQPLVDAINQGETEMEKLSDTALRESFLAARRNILASLESVDRLGDDTATKRQTQKVLDDFLVPVFAMTREAAKRTVGMRHFDVQLMGGIVLHQGKIAEMKTGEGKTLVATLPLALNALAGRGAHLVTVNDYLAKRDAGWNGPLYHLLGLSVAFIAHDLSFIYDPSMSIEGESDPRLAHFRPVSRPEAYGADITYGTNNEFGFDYLRDHMVTTNQALRQRPPFYAIVDEVDSILIDEARTPLIISGPAAQSTSLYATFAEIVPRLKPEQDYAVDEKDRAVTITDSGIAKVESALNTPNMYDGENIILVHHLEEALRAHALYRKNKDYVVKDGQVIIVDEFTGRLMPGRRYSEGLHQAIEAKERVEVQRESETLATISFQNLFRLYPKLSGMTGTAATEAEEFWKIYQLDVVIIPTHRPIDRKDIQDNIYKTEDGKFQAVIADISERRARGQPILVGTISIAKSEKLARLLKKHHVTHQVLNAKHHEREAKIIMQAGQPGAVTVATNMAGRGVDIILGGTPPRDATSAAWKAWQADHQKVIAAGGLHVIGTERHESRRIDNQLRGRAGRQGDPGSSMFYVSMDDDLMRIFGGNRLKSMMERLGLPEDVPITHSLITRSIESAQKRVEGHNFDIRKHLVEYDDVMNKHREIIYRKRRRILELEPSANPNQASVTEANWLHRELLGLMTDEARVSYENKIARYGLAVTQEVERLIYLRLVDQYWIEHLNRMDELRHGIGLQAYGQIDPLVQYKREAFSLFERLLAAIETDVIHHLATVEITPAAPPVAPAEPHLDFRGADESLAGGGIFATAADETIISPNDNSSNERPSPMSPKIGRNDPCWCGSGKKFKKCHGNSSDNR